MKNNKGFTLIELIATVLLLSIISLIAIISIDKVVKDNNKNSHKTEVNTILRAVETYVASSDQFTPEGMNGLTIYLFEVSDFGYLDKNIKDPLNNKEIDMQNSYVTITKETNTTKTDNTDLDYIYSGNYLYVLTIVYGE